MNQIDEIKELQRQGLGPQEIAGRLKLNRKTAAKYMKVEDFNGGLPGKRAPASKLDPWKPKIDEWLAEDRRMRFKQRHTAKRVHERLQNEYPEAYGSSYPLVQRYLKEKKHLYTKFQLSRAQPSLRQNESLDRFSKKPMRSFLVRVKLLRIGLRRLSQT